MMKGGIVAEKIKAFIKSLLKTETSERKAFNLIFCLSFASYLINGIINAIDYESFTYFLSPLIAVLFLGCLYLACFFFIKREKPMATTVLTAVFAATSFAGFIGSWYNYRYYGVIWVLLDIVNRLSLIAGTVLLFVYHVKRIKGEDAGKIYACILYAGVVSMAAHGLSLIISFVQVIINFIDYYYFGLQELLVYLFRYIVLDFPMIFIVLGIWLAVDLVHEQENKNVQEESVEAGYSEDADTPANEENSQL